jgi:hypothetical protein
MSIGLSLAHNHIWRSYTDNSANAKNKPACNNNVFFVGERQPMVLDWLILKITAMPWLAQQNMKAFS